MIQWISGNDPMFNCATLLQENNNKALFGFASVNSPHNDKFHSNDMSQKRYEIKNNGNSNGNKDHNHKVETTTEKFVWGFQTIPTLYSIYQKVFRINSLNIHFSLASPLLTKTMSCNLTIYFFRFLDEQ